MKKNDDVIKIADELLHDAIMQEGERLEKVLGPVTYENPEGEDIDAGFQKLLKERQELKAKNRAYHDQFGSHDSLDKENELYTADSDIEKETCSKEGFSVEPKSDKSKKAVRKYFGTLVKAAMVVLVAGVCVVGFSMQSEATRMWWMESFGWEIGDDSATQVDNDTNREVADAPEWEAAATIENELGIKVPRLVYMPTKLEFSDYRYETISNRATMYYKMGEEYLMLNMVYGTKDTTYGANFDGSILSEEIWDTAFAPVIVREVETDANGQKSVSAEWNYQDAHYEFFGRISKEEMKKIIENIVL